MSTDTDRPTTPLARVIAAQGRRQDWLAQRAGLRREYVNRLVTGRLPMTTGAAERLAGVLGVPPETLFVTATGREVTPTTTEDTDAAD